MEFVGIVDSHKISTKYFYSSRITFLSQNRPCSRIRAQPSDEIVNSFYGHVPIDLAIFLEDFWSGFQFRQFLLWSWSDGTVRQSVYGADNQFFSDFSQFI